MEKKKKDYILSKGLALLFEKRYGLVLSSSIKKAIHILEEKFVDELKPFLDKKFNFIVLDEEEINKSVCGLLMADKRPLISFDDIYLTDKADEIYNVTRLTSPDYFKDKEIGPRPISSVLNEQINKIAKKYKGKEVIVFDIGAFTGKTLQSEIRRLKNKCVDVKRVYLAISDKRITANILKEEKVDVVAVNDYDFGEWVEIRDLFGFDGRKVKMRGVQEFEDFKSSDTIIIPYKENLTEWASIPKGYAEDVKDICMRYNTKVIEILSDKYQVVYKPIRKNSNGTQSYFLEFKRKDLPK